MKYADDAWQIANWLNIKKKKALLPCITHDKLEKRSRGGKKDGEK